MNTVSIRRVTENDLAQLQEIGKQTFSEAFSAVNRKENFDAYLENSFSLAQLTSELNNPNAEFFFAELEGWVIGYLKLNFGAAQTELKDDNALEIERIYVLQEFHGKNVGQILFEKAMQIAAERKVDYVWLGVWEENPRAIQFYKKNGFIEFGRHIFKLGDEKQTDCMMKLKLK